MVQLIDTHTHLFAEEFEEDRDLAVIRAVEAGVTRLFMPNIDETSVDALLSLCESHKECYPLIGFHPTSVDADWKERLAKVEKVFRSGRRFYGIGEVGLDLYWDATFRKEQMHVLDIQIGWALEADLPLIIHCRNAQDDLMQVMEPYRNTSLRGIFHSFSGTEEEAAELLAYKNFMLGVNGIVTFKKSTLGDVLKSTVPLERVVLETDSPYLAPVPHRGRRNESAYLCDTAMKLCSIYGVDMETMAVKTTENALKVFDNATGRL